MVELPGLEQMMVVFGVPGELATAVEHVSRNRSSASRRRTHVESGNMALDQCISQLPAGLDFSHSSVFIACDTMGFRKDHVCAELSKGDCAHQRKNCNTLIV